MNYECECLDILSHVGTNLTDCKRIQAFVYILGEGKKINNTTTKVRSKIYVF